MSVELFVMYRTILPVTIEARFLAEPHEWHMNEKSGKSARPCTKGANNDDDDDCYGHNNYIS